jgi:hypothetical protein
MKSKEASARPRRARLLRSKMDMISMDSAVTGVNMKVMQTGDRRG